ncbi:MAG: hypothetical protein J3Q66DRAFT_436287 [Benniella sp.]|nr:MAG: hypothetical protein J3Q66DRAFT_436287 [Benniella sp.]
MSRRDISEILERLSLNHRNSLAEKACAYLQAVESNRAIKNHPSHAAICVDIAADQLSIEVSRQALIRLSGAASPKAYNSSHQTLTLFLTGKSRRHDQLESVPEAKTRGQQAASSSSMDVDLSSDLNHAHISQLISDASQTYLRQLAVSYGSMELSGLVLECLGRFFPDWLKTLPPAQRVHVKYSDPTWIAAAFWLCAMARRMTVVKSDDKSSSGTGAGAEVGGKGATAKIGGRGGKDLKGLILKTVEHKVKPTELDKAIGIIENQMKEFLMSLRRPTEGRRGRTVSNSSTPKELSSRTHIDESEEDEGSTLGGISKGTTSATTRTTTRSHPSGRHHSAYAGLSAKRQISNVSQISMSGADDEEQDDMEDSPEATQPSAQRPSKRKKLDSQDVQLLSANIMNPKKRPATKTLKETAAASQDANRLLNKRRKTGGIYSMIPRVKYEDTKAYAYYLEWKARILKEIESKGC